MKYSEFDCAELIKSLNQKFERRNEIVKIMNDLKENKPDNYVNRLFGYQTEISLINSEMKMIRESIEYPRFKMFTTAVKAYLTKEQYHECWKMVDKALENPEIFLQNKNSLN